MRQINTAVVGCGNISEIYLRNLSSRFRNVKLYAVSDLIEERARKAAEFLPEKKIMSLDEILADHNIELVLNLTTPPDHFPISRRILESGKHIYSEKPLSLTFSEGQALLDLAEDRGLLIGSAPDTFLGAGLQTCRRLIDCGLIGNVIGAEAFMLCHGHESWHPDPEFYYKTGGGPMFDMGPYYLTALVSLIGPVKSVSGMCAKGFAERTITSEEKYGQTIQVDVATHVNGLLRFENGAVGTIITSFDVWGSRVPNIEIHGSRGSLIVPDPNTFGGKVWLKQSFDEDFKEIPLLSTNCENSRGIGLSEMVDCILQGRSIPRASGRLALHVLDIMERIGQSSEAKAELELRSRTERPEAYFS